MNNNYALRLGFFLLGTTFISTPLLANTPDGFTQKEWSGIQSMIEADRYLAHTVADESGASGRIEAYNQRVNESNTVMLR